MQIRPLAVALVLSSCVVRHASAQIRSSERGLISQEVDGTKITVDFGRPQLRGRTLVPGILHWGEVWTPGANWATTFEVNHPIKLEGHPLAAGKYSMWLSPKEGEWTIYLNKDWHRFHESRPKVPTMALAFTKAPLTGLTNEALTFQFPQVDHTGATLEFRWGTVVIPFRIDVLPTLAPGTWTEASAAPYVGEYSMVMYGEKKSDSTVEKLSIQLKDGRLHGIPTMPDFEFAFIDPAKKGGPMFIAFVDKGEITDIEVAAPTHWVRQGSRVTGFVVMAFKDVWFKAVRK